MIKTDTIGNSKEKFLILECRRADCKKSLVLPEKTTDKQVESKGWYMERKKNLALCPGCIKLDEEKKAAEKCQSDEK